MKLHVWIDLNKRKSYTRSVTLASIFLKLFPFVTFSCLDNNSCSTYTIGMKLHIWIDLDKRKCHAQGL